jgi:hypothetical protein
MTNKKLHNHDDHYDYLSSKRFESIVASLWPVAMKSPHNSKHAASLFRGGSTLIYPSCNEPRTCYGGHVNKCSGHAEFMTCWRRKPSDTKKYNIIVIRISRDPKNLDDWILTESRPCNDCITNMKNNQIDRVFYSTWEGRIKCERVKDMEFRHQSRGFKNMNLKINNPNPDVNF